MARSKQRAPSKKGSPPRRRPKSRRSSRRTAASGEEAEAGPVERELEHTDGIQFALLVEVASRRNTRLKKADPEIDVADLPDIFVAWAGGAATPGMPFRLSVPGLGSVIVDPELRTLATEGEHARSALASTPELGARAERHATRVVGLGWKWAPSRKDREPTERDKKFLDSVAKILAEGFFKDGTRRRSGGDHETEPPSTVPPTGGS